VERTLNAGTLLHLHSANSGEKREPELIKPAFIIGAYGRRSAIDRDLDRPFLHALNGSVGLKLHFSLAQNAQGIETQKALMEKTEVYMFAGGYCGINKIENEHVNICVLFEKKAFAKVASSQWKDVARFIERQNPAIVKRLAGLVPQSDAMLVVSQMPSTMKEQALEDMVFIGDAAGMIAPLCGDGQAMALEAGIMLADMIIDVFPVPGQIERDLLRSSKLGQEWQKRWRSKFASRLHAGRVIQYAMLRPALAEASVAALRMAPSSAVNLLAKVTRSHA
jgi:flavin-dependent dehydrogenase